MGCMMVRVKVDVVDSRVVHSDRCALVKQKRSDPDEVGARVAENSVLDASAQSLSRLAETHTRATTHAGMRRRHDSERNEKRNGVNGRRYENCAWRVTILT